MTKLLVTGATGFVGSHLLPLLRRDGFSIRATSRQPSCINYSAVEMLLVPDFNAHVDWSEALQDVDCVIHLAARAHILKEEVAEPEAAFFEVNTAATIHLARQSLSAEVKHFIFISSIGAMATLSDHPLSENSICQPDTPYGRSKLAAELALQELCADCSMTWTILRPTLVYGPGNPGNMALLLKLVNQGLPLPLGAVYNRRSLLYVGNLVDVIRLCIDHSAARNETFLVSDNEVLSTPSLIRQIGQAMGTSPCLLSISPGMLMAFAKLLGQRERLRRLTGSLEVRNHHLKNTLQWFPPYGFARGIQDTVNWFIDSSI